MSKQTSNAIVNDQQLKEWEAKYGEDNVKCVTIKVSPTDEAKGYFVAPSKVERPRSLYSRTLTFWKSNQVLEAGEVVLNECWLGGDPRFKEAESMVHITAAQALANEVDFLGVTILPILIV